MLERAPRLIRLSDRTVDLPARQVWSDGKARRLSAREAEVLSFLVRRPGETVSRDALLEGVFGYAADYATRAVDTTVRRLRVKVEADPAAPVHVISVFGEGYRFEPPPRSRSRAPTERTSLLGREAELAEVCAALRQGPVTVLGPGGVGKTRLAQRVAAIEEERDVLWCGLTAARSLDDLVRAVALAAGLHLEASREVGAWLEPVGQSLRGRGPTLLVLDNVEQIVGSVARAIAVWVRPGGTLTVLCTSRHVTGSQGEQVVALDGLEPQFGHALFVERARSAGVPHEQLDDPSVHELVQRLDGLPLALELAAVRCRMLSPAQLTSRLDQRFRLLATRDRDADPRHRSLHATLEASWELLSAPEQRALARLSVSPGPVVPALQAHLLADLELGDPVEIVDQLIEASLVQRREGAVVLLETIREFARRKLDAAGGRAQAEALHGDWVVAHVYQLTLELDTPDVARAADALDVLAPHLHQVVDALGEARPDLVLRAAVYLSVHGQIRGPSISVLPILDHAVEVGERTGSEWACRALCARGLLRRLHGQQAGALRDGLRALELVEPGSEFHARCLADLALLHANVGEHQEAMARYPEAVAALKAHGLHRPVATTQASWAAARVIGNDVGADTLALFEASLGAIRELGMVRFEAGVRANYATALFGVGRLAEGKVHLEEALITLSAMGARRRRATVLYNLACLEGAQGNDDACERHTLEARSIFEEFGHGQFLVMSAINLAVVRLKRDEFSEALAWLDRGEQDLQASGDLHAEMILTCYRAITRALCGMVSDASADAQRAEEIRLQRGVEDNGLVAMAAAFVALAEAGLTDDPAPSLAVVDRYLEAPGWGSGVMSLVPLLRRLRAEREP